MSWVAAGVASAGLTLSLYQNYDNKKQAKKDAANRPKLDLSAQKNFASQVSQQGVPEQTQQNYLSNLQRGSAYGLGQIGTRKGGLAGVAAINQQQNQGYQDLMSADAQARMSNQRYGQELSSQAYGQEFEINQLNPYNIGTQRDSANRGAAYQNINNSLQAGGSAYMYGQRTKAMKGIPAQMDNPQSNYYSNYNQGVEPQYNTMANGQDSSTSNPYAGQQYFTGGSNQGYKWGQ